MSGKIILIVGPTAVGKTSISIEIAKYYNAEIINADSRYLFKEPVIATAKVTDSEMNGIKHHMIDIISLNDDYSIYDYQKDAREILNDLIKKNRNVVIVGGSGLYIKALLYDYKLDKENKKCSDYSKYSNEELKFMVDKIDADNYIHINNRKRLERFIDYYNNTGSTINKLNNKNDKVYDFISIGLECNRDELYNRINNRVDIMFNNDILNEAKLLMNYNYFNEIIGYKELGLYFNNKITLEEAKDQIKKNSRHYAKRQMTWFKNQMKDINWINVNYNNINESINEIINIIDKN